MTNIIYDAHTHIFPQKIAKKASESISEFYYDYPMFSSAGMNELISCEQNAGISNYLICSSAVVPQQTTAINDFISSVCLKEKSFFGLGTLHPDFEDIQGELARIKALGLHGIKLHPDFQNFNIDSEKAMLLYNECIRYDLPVLFHMGDDRYDRSSPKRLMKVIEKLPSLRIHAAHFGGYNDWDNAYKYLPVHENLYFDTSSSLFAISKERAFQFFEKHGTDKFLFGSDFPMWNPKTELERVTSLGLSKDDLHKILCRNFEAFYKIVD